MQPEQWEQLKTEIHNKCVAYDYIDANDNSLSEFIISLIQVGNTPEQVTQELTSMVGSDYDPNVTEWICTRIKELEAPPSEPEPMEQDQQAPSEVQQQQQEQPQQQQQEEVPQQPPQETQSQQQPQEAAPTPAPVVSSRVERPVKSRIFTQALGDVLNNGNRSEKLHRSKFRSRSRSRSPPRQSQRYDRSDRASRHERVVEDRNVFSRIGNAKTEERPSVFDRLGGSRASQIKSELSSHEDNRDGYREGRREVKRERCKYWPTCKNGKQCTYFHPTKICPDFPNCPKKASECMFVHPETKQSVQHQVPPAHLQQPQQQQQPEQDQQEQQQQGQPQQKPGFAQIPIPCRFFPYCSNPVCPYMHPIMPPQAYFMQGYGAGSYKVQVPCKNGDACTRPDCHFLHPKDPNPQAEIICKFDGACTRPNCFYKHTKQNGSKNMVLKNNEPTNARQFSVPDEEIEEHITVGNSADLIKTDEAQPETN